MTLSRPLVVSIAVAAFALAVVFSLRDPTAPSEAPPGRASQPEVPPSVAAAPPPVPVAPSHASTSNETDSEFSGDEALRPGAHGYDNDFRTDYAEGYWRGADVEEMREAIYDRQIDRVERLHLLDEFVETGDTDPRQLWETSWGSADDFKDETNGFALQQAGDGRFYFIPDAKTMQQNTLLEPLGAYEFEEEGQLFVRKTHYYGKPMTSALKFLRDDVLVMMIVSGDKVDLNIYEQSRE